MENKRSFFKKLGDSILHPQFAYDVINSEKSGAGGYFMLLCLLISVVFALAMILSAYPMGGIDELENSIDDFLGDFSIRDGKLTTSLTEPYIFDTGSSLLIIDNDPEAAILNEYSGYAGQLAYFGPDVIISKVGMQMVPMSYDSLGIEIDKAGVLRMIRGNAWWVLLLVGLFYWVGKVVSGLLFALLIAVLAMLLASVFKVRASYGKLYALSLYALTGIFLVELLFACVNILAGTSITMPVYVGWIVTLIFMGFYLFVTGKHIGGEENETRTMPDDF